MGSEITRALFPSDVGWMPLTKALAFSSQLVSWETHHLWKALEDTHKNAMTRDWRPEDNLQESPLSVYDVGARDWAQLSGLTIGAPTCRIVEPGTGNF